MPTVMRMARRGKKNQPFYQIVVTDKEHARDGRHTEKLGYFNPSNEKQGFQLDLERYNYWLGKGAKPSHLLKTLVKKQAKA